CRFKFRLIFRAPSRKFKILAIPDVLAHGKSYEHGFVKKLNGHKHCTKSHADSGFGQFFMHRLGNSKYWPFPMYMSRKFKILAIPNVLAHGKSYEHGFAKKHDGHKLYGKSHAESSFDRFFVHHLRNLKYWPFPTY
ncbi:hypothetical protein GW17_00061945, partial [Ensete ventricosum]